MAKSEYTDLTYFMIYGYKLVKNSESIRTRFLSFRIKGVLFPLLEFGLSFFWTAKTVVTLMILNCSTSG